MPSTLYYENMFYVSIMSLLPGWFIIMSNEKLKWYKHRPERPTTMNTEIIMADYLLLSGLKC